MTQRWLFFANKTTFPKSLKLEHWFACINSSVSNIERVTRINNKNIFNWTCKCYIKDNNRYGLPLAPTLVSRVTLRHDVCSLRQLRRQYVLILKWLQSSLQWSINWNKMIHELLLALSGYPGTIFTWNKRTGLQVKQKQVYFTQQPFEFYSGLR